MSSQVPHTLRPVEDAHARYAQATAQGTYRGCAAYNDFREIIARGDIDAVCNATPDHRHAIPSIMAARAGTVEVRYSKYKPGGAYTVKPWDGLRVRASLKPMGVSIETINAAMDTVTVRKDKTEVALKLSKPHDKAAKGQLTICGMPAGTYRVSTATTSTEIPCDGKLQCGVPLPVEATVTLVEDETEKERQHEKYERQIGISLTRSHGRWAGERAEL
jgi:hypothetical protein